MTAKQVARLNRKATPMLGATEVAGLLGVEQRNLRKVARLPAAAQDDLARGALWRRDVIEDFVAGRNAKKEVKAK